MEGARVSFDVGLEKSRPALGALAGGGGGRCARGRFGSVAVGFACFEAFATTCCRARCGGAPPLPVAGVVQWGLIELVASC